MTQVNEVPARARVIPANEYVRERWRNRLGWTREIVRMGQRREAGGVVWTQADKDWDWRLSIAEIESDAAFSAFPGIDRELMLLAGNGLRLRRDGAVDTLSPPHDRLRFAGEDKVGGELLDGRVQAFNLMWRRGRVHVESWHRPLVGPMVIFAEPGAAWVVHLIAGQAAFPDDSGLAALEAGDTAVLQAGGQRLRHVLEGGGEAFLVKLGLPETE
jgi:hypothetical protein